MKNVSYVRFPFFVVQELLRTNLAEVQIGFEIVSREMLNRMEMGG